MASIDITGQRFAMLVAVKRADKPRGEWRWLFRCDCGAEAIIRGSKVRGGYTKSCGCLKASTHRDRLFKHGESSGTGARNGSATRLYRIWFNMRRRCRNPRNQNWKYYGGRGIGVCAEWDYFPAFREWAMGHGYADELSIDRIDGDGNYDPSNCRWATRIEQLRNRTFRKP